MTLAARSGHAELNLRLMLDGLNDTCGHLGFAPMITAKFFQHSGSQAVRLPKACRFKGTEVLIEKRGDEIVLKPMPRSKINTLAEIARHPAESSPDAAKFPESPRPSMLLMPGQQAEEWNDTFGA